MKRLILIVVMLAVMLGVANAEESKEKYLPESEFVNAPIKVVSNKEAPKQEVKAATPVCFDCRIKELTAEYNKITDAIVRAQARQEQIRGAIIELQKLSPKVEKKVETKK